MSAWIDRALDSTTAVALSTSTVALVSGFLLGIYSSRGYLLSPALTHERLANYRDPVESEESEIDDDTVLDHAPNWANGDEADVRDGLKNSSTGTQGISPSNEECKLVLVVRSDLGMTKGKIAAQCGHATLACFKTMQRLVSRDPKSSAAVFLRNWERGGQAKIALQTKSEDELMKLMGVARSLGITAEVISDAGRTQIESGSLTVLGIGPAPKSLVDKVTGGLKLL